MREVNVRSTVRKINRKTSTRQEILSELVSKAGLADKIRKIDDLTANLGKMMNNYLNTRTGVESLTDSQRVANALHSVQQTALITGKVSGIFKDITGIISSIEPTGGNVSVEYERNSEGQINKQITSTIGDKINPYSVASKSASLVGNMVDSVQTAKIHKYNNIAKELSDIIDIESKKAHINSLFERAKLLVNALNEIKRSSKNRKRDIGVLFENFCEEITEQFYSEIRENLQNHFYNNSRFYPKKIEYDDFKNSEVEIKDYLNYFANYEMERAYHFLKIATNSENKLGRKVSNFLSSKLYEKFFNEIEKDKKAINSIKISQFSKDIRYVRLAIKNNIDPLGMLVIVNKIRESEISRSGSIAHGEVKRALKKLLSALERCENRHQFTSTAKGIYLIVILDDVLRPAGLSSKIISEMAELIDLPKETSDLFYNFYFNRGFSSDDNYPSSDRKDKSIKEITKATSSSKELGKRNEDSVFEKVFNLSSLMAKNTTQLIDKDKEKTAVLVCYAYYKLCRNYGISYLDRSGKMSKINLVLKNLAVEIVASNVKNFKNKKVDKYIDFLRSSKNNSAFLDMVKSDYFGDVVKSKSLDKKFKTLGEKLVRITQEGQKKIQNTSIVEKLVPIKNTDSFQSDSTDVSSYVGKWAKYFESEEKKQVEETVSEEDPSLNLMSNEEGSKHSSSVKKKTSSPAKQGNRRVKKGLKNKSKKHMADASVVSVIKDGQGFFSKKKLGLVSSMVEVQVENKNVADSRQVEDMLLEMIAGN